MKKIVLLRQEVDVYQFLIEYEIDADVSANVAATAFEAELDAGMLSILQQDSRVIGIEDLQVPEVDGISERIGLPWTLVRLSDSFLGSSNFSRSTKFEISRDGAGVVIYSIDEGTIEESHPEFSEAFIRYNPPAQTAAVNDHAHRIAGSIVGKRLGIAPRATLVVINRLSTQVELAAVCDWIIADKQAHGLPAVVTCSTRWTTQSDTVDTAASSVIAAGMQWFNSAGNDNVDTATQSPVNLPAVCTVGGIEPGPIKASASSYGAHVKIWAPYRYWQLSDISSAVPGLINYSGPNGDIEPMISAMGTSYSTPATAAVAALILQEQPTLTPAQVLDVLINQWAIKNEITGIPVNGGDNVMLHLGSARTTGKYHSGPTPTEVFDSLGSGKLRSSNAVWSAGGTLVHAGSGKAI